MHKVRTGAQVCIIIIIFQRFEYYLLYDRHCAKYCLENVFEYESAKVEENAAWAQFPSGRKP